MIRKDVILIIFTFFLLGLDSCSENYEFCPNCKAPSDTPPVSPTGDDVATPTTTPVTPSLTPNTPTMSSNSLSALSTSKIKSHVNLPSGDKGFEQSILRFDISGSPVPTPLFIE